MKPVSTPVMVQVPGTDRHINIAPLFDLQNEWFDSPEGMAEAVDRAVKFLATNYTGECGSELTHIYANLFMIRDMFKKMV